MTRREFLRRSAPLIAAGAVTPWFVEAIARRLFGPRRYWDMGAARQKAVVCHLPVQPVHGFRMEVVNVGDQPIRFQGVDEALGPDQTAILTMKTKDPGLFESRQVDFRFWDVSFVRDPLPGQEFLHDRVSVYKPVG